MSLSDFGVLGHIFPTDVLLRARVSRVFRPPVCLIVLAPVVGDETTLVGGETQGIDGGEALVRRYTRLISTIRGDRYKNRIVRTREEGGGGE